MIVLIHGSTCGATYSFLRKSHPNGCFDGFEKFTEEVKLFWWAKCNEKLTFWQCLNPFKIKETYQIDKKYVKTEIAQHELSKFLQENKPKIIIAHSVGCDYILEYLANYNKNEKQFKKQNDNQHDNQNENGLENLREIYLLQSDSVAKNLDLKRFVENFEKLQRENKKIQIYNYFCPLDTALISSVLANWQIPDGLFGSRNPFLQNHFVLLNNFNLHATMPKSAKFAARIIEKLKTFD